MLRICLQTLRSRRGSLAGAFVAILLAVGFASATGRLMAGALEAPGPGRFAATDAVVRADPTVPLGADDSEEVVPPPRLAAGLVARAAAVRGVRRAIGDITFPVGVWKAGRAVGLDRDTDHLRGHDWASATLSPYVLQAGRAPSKRSDVVMDARVKASLGSEVLIAAPGGEARYRVVGIARSSAPRDGGQAAVFFARGVASSLSGAAGRVNSVAVIAQDGTSAQVLRADLREHLGPSVEVTDRAHAADADAGDARVAERPVLVAIFGTMGGIAAAVALFVVSGTFALAIAQRRRETAVLRALGASPRQVRRLIAGEAFLVSLIAGALGAAMGGPMAAFLADTLQARGTVPAGFEPSGSWLPAAAALLLGVVIAQLAVVAAARRAGRTRPAEALREAAVEHARPGVIAVFAGLACLAGGAAMAMVFDGIWARAFSILTGTVLAMGVGLLGRSLLGLPVAMLAWPLRGLGAAGLLAGTSLAANRWRTAGLATPIVLVVMLAGTQGVVQSSDQREVEKVTRARVTADHVLIGSEGSPLAGRTRVDVSALRGVRAASPVVATEVFALDHGLAGASPWPAAGLDLTSSQSALDLERLEGNFSRVSGDRIAVSRVLARTGHIGVGDTIKAELGDRTPTSLNVVAVYERAAGLGDVVLDPATARRHAAVTSDAAIFVDSGPGGEAALDRYRSEHPAVEVLDRDAYLRSVTSSDHDQAWAVWMIIALAATFSGLALINTAAMATAERRNELATIRLLGGTKGHAIRMVLLEMLPTVAVATATGAVIVGVALLGVPHGITGEPIVTPVALIGGLLGGAVIFGTAASAITAGIALRTSPAEAMRMRD